MNTEKATPDVLAALAADDREFKAKMTACEKRAEVVLDDDFDMEDGE